MSAVRGRCPSSFGSSGIPASHHIVLSQVLPATHPACFALPSSPLRTHPLSCSLTQLSIQMDLQAAVALMLPQGVRLVPSQHAGGADPF